VTQKTWKVLPFKVALKKALEHFMTAEPDLLAEYLGKIATVRSDTYMVQVHNSVEEAFTLQEKIHAASRSLPVDVFFFVVGQITVPTLVADEIARLRQIHADKAAKKNKTVVIIDEGSHE
jgi:hypothetical protein